MQAHVLRVRWFTGRLTSIAGAAGLAIACGFIYTFDPVTSGMYPLCPFRAVTGLYCPGCGTARALHAILRGHPVKAFAYNPLTILMLPVLAAWVIAGHLTRTGKRQIDHRWAWGLLVVVVVFGISRNIPVAPFTALAP